MQQLKLYKLDNQRYPSAEQGLDALVHKPTAGHAAAQLARLHRQAAGRPPGAIPISTPTPGVNNEIDVYSFGADGRVGGEGKDADIGSWQ